MIERIVISNIIKKLVLLIAPLSKNKVKIIPGMEKMNKMFEYNPNNQIKKK
jgi:hypothetical protein